MRVVYLNEHWHYTIPPNEDALFRFLMFNVFDICDHTMLEVEQTEHVVVMPVL